MLRFVLWLALQDNPAVKPVPRDAGWVKRHEGFVQEAKKGGVDVLFLGDSITDGWRGGGKRIWDKEFGPLKPVNFGIGGDRTEHVLWRIQNGELEGIQPKAAVLMIGTNNVGMPPKNIAEGVKAILNELRTKQPQMRILLLAIFPRSEKPDAARTAIKSVNAILATYEDKKMIHYLDIGDKFLQADGTMSKDVMPDFLHPSDKGYQIWADAIREPLARLLQDAWGPIQKTLDAGDAFFGKGQYSRGIAEYRKVANLTVKSFKELGDEALKRANEKGLELLAQAEALAKDGKEDEARKIILQVSRDFTPLECAKEAAKRLKK